MTMANGQFSQRAPRLSEGGQVARGATQVTVSERERLPQQAVDCFEIGRLQRAGGRAEDGIS